MLRIWRIWRIGGYSQKSVNGGDGGGQVMSLSAADDVVVFLPTMSLAGDQSVGEKVLRDVHVQKRRLQSPGGGVLVKTSSWLEVRGVW